MSWEPGKQERRPSKFRHVNEELAALEGPLEEKEAKLWLYKFLRANPSFACELITGIELYPFQHIVIKSILESDYSLLIASRGAGKTFLTALYIVLDAIFNQGVKIGVMAPSFRQSKLVCAKIEEISKSHKAAFLNQCITNTRKSNDQWTLNIGDSEIHFVPLGTGEKLRGFRFHRMVIDEMLLMPEKIYNEVIIPFLTVVQNPTERDKIAKAENELIRQGLMQTSERKVWENNKLISLSSASYKFEFLYKMFETYEKLILEGKSDADKLREERNDQKLNGTCFVFQLSHHCIPAGMYDQNLIQQAKNTMSASQFEREFGAQFTNDSSGYFKASSMKECIIPDGDFPMVEIYGDNKSDYLLAFDPSWSGNESSDDFAIHILKLNYEAKNAVIVHSYALSGNPMKAHIEYFKYVLTHFNIVAMVGDYNGGLQFIQAANESEIFKANKLEIKLIENINFDKNSEEEYAKNLTDAKNQYNKSEGRICFLRTPTSAWIRQANEQLQASFHHKKIWFGSRHNLLNLDDIENNIDIEDIKFSNMSEYNDHDSKKSKMVDFLENQTDMLNLTRAECAMIVISTTSTGTQSFDLPPNLKRKGGQDRPRKDSYSALVLANWYAKIWFDMREIKEEQVSATFTPMLI